VTDVTNMAKRGISVKVKEETNVQEIKDKIRQKDRRKNVKNSQKSFLDKLQNYVA